MNAKLHQLPLDERIRLVEDLWVLWLTRRRCPSRRLKGPSWRRLDAYDLDKNAGRLASDVVADIRRKL